MIADDLAKTETRHHTNKSADDYNINPFYNKMVLNM
jgi:hypothetical protein